MHNIPKHMNWKFYSDEDYPINKKLDNPTMINPAMTKSNPIYLYFKNTFLNKNLEKIAVNMIDPPLII